jgi:hypothetical protein
MAYNPFMHDSQIPKPNKPAKKTYFGLIALTTGIISVSFLGAHFGVAYLNITPDTFNKLNNLTTLVFCILTPLAFALGVLGYTGKNDSKRLSIIAITLVTVPFLIIFAQFVYSMMSGAITAQ